MGDQDLDSQNLRPVVVARGFGKIGHIRPLILCLDLSAIIHHDVVQDNAKLNANGLASRFYSLLIKLDTIRISAGKAGYQVERERSFLVGEHVPSLAVEFSVAHAGDGQAFVGEFF